MYIKQIIIQGFKSYKDQTVFEPFSPKHNVIVGRNGSGKSNFFAAIRFVLSDQYKQLGREDRQGLLHEGAGSAVMSAYVELIFDNSDERLPTNTPEVILRRTIGQKKDEYSLNRKNTTKQEVMSLLETAGFSSSNPYYIVPQGRVTAITNMKDHERLNMLKTVAGTEVYESRRAESRKIMGETENKRSRIDDLLEQVRGRLGELEEEKEELRAFQERDRERRCLEYTIHHRDQESLEEALAKLNDEVEGGVEQTDDSREALRLGEKQLEVIDARIRELEQQIQLLNGERAQYKEDRVETARVKAQAEADVQSMADSQTAQQQTRAQRSSELKDVQKQIKQRESELAQLLPKYNGMRNQERQLKQQVEEDEAARQRLYAKQGRQSQFRTKKERDDWLKQEISDVNTAIATRKAISMERTEDIQSLEAEVLELETHITELRSRIENRGDEQQNISADVQQAKDARERLQDRRKELWREQAKLDSIIENAQQQYDRAERALGHTMDRNLHQGLLSLRQIVERRKIPGAYGVLGELIQYPERFRTAIEVTAGTSLFDYIVEDDETALQLSEILRREKLGRVTFVPLSRIRARQANLPSASDAVHLLSKITFDPTYEKAMQQVFGQTIVCPNLQIAAQYARSHQVMAITPDGDVSDRKGALTGGFHDESKSRLEAIKRFTAARDELEQVSSRKGQIVTELDKTNQAVDQASNLLQKVEQKRFQLEGGYGPLREELRRKEHDLNSRIDELDARRRQLEEVRSLERTFAAQLSGYQSELTSDFKKALSNDEERQLERFNEQLPGVKKQQQAASASLSSLEEQKNGLDMTLRVNLKPRLDQLLSEDAEADAVGDGKHGGTQLKERQADLKRADKSLKSIDGKLNDTEQTIEQAQEQLQASQGERANKSAEVDRLESAIRNHRKMMEKGAQKKAALNLRLNEVKTSINGLGILPEAAFTPQYRDMSANTATSRLHKAKEALKKYGHVNKKAFEQFAQFERQRETLEGRRQDLDASDASIRELIDVLDQRKDQDIERTFKQVSREFARIFERLVPAGKGRLIIQRRSDKQANGGAGAGDDDDDDSAADDDQPPRTGVENYTGVGISVSFNSKHDEQQRIQQLSGGQKSLCALALVFAIQASDPAPFYLFDEIDANLDAQYRTAVAELLKQSSQTGQFICTTFRPEMLLVAEKCYGVGFQSKASTINVVSREDALEFVEGQIGGS